MARPMDDEDFIAPRTGTDWQPIDDATRGTVILAAWCTMSKRWSIGEAYYYEASGDYKGDDGWWWANTSPGDYGVDSVITGGFTPRYFMPLPPPPTEKE